MELIERMLAGEELPLARLITMVERQCPETPQIMHLIHPHLGHAYTLGITGPPGAGKSTLVDKLTTVMRNLNFSVGIIAVDPTSPFSGGAVLGDRIRMQQHYLDNGVFIRSMATRGSHGGLPITTRGVVKLMDAFGKDFILVETVGVGQTELDIMEAADTTVVVLVPEAGDTIQTLKAGLLEIADIFVVNKADREGANYLVTELMSMLSLYHRSGPWEPPVLATQALNNVGIEELYQAILHHRQVLQQSGQLEEKRRQQRRREFLQTIENRLRERLHGLLDRDRQLLRFLEQVEKGEMDPYSASQEVLSNKTFMERWLSQLA